MTDGDVQKSKPPKTPKGPRDFCQMGDTHEKGTLPSAPAAATPSPAQQHQELSHVQLEQIRQSAVARLLRSISAKAQVTCVFQRLNDERRDTLLSLVDRLVELAEVLIRFPFAHADSSVLWAAGGVKVAAAILCKAVGILMVDPTGPSLTLLLTLIDGVCGLLESQIYFFATTDDALVQFVVPLQQFEQVLDGLGADVGGTASAVAAQECTSQALEAVATAALEEAKRELAGLKRKREQAE
eukprot:m.356828 g.356828  ORF g.356828 m.356828 type:complete len:241 (-) comp55958_c1_seq24:751-1473(-)